MYRVLMFGMTENPGGVESFLINYYRHIDRTKIQFDFLCNSYEPVAYEDELKELGGRTFHICARSVNYKTYKAEIEDLFQKHLKEWDAIWVNICSLANIDYLKLAKKYGIERRIIHSHNSQNMDSRLRGMLHKFNKLSIDKYATDYWACSDDAAKWFYKDKMMDKVIVIHNAIDVDRIAFNEQKRQTIRDQYGLKDKFIIGNVGRLHFQKNQSFMLDIFKEYSKKDQDALLVIVGQGPDEKMLKDKTKTLGLEDKVIFTGLQKDIQAWLSSFDVFLFPSVFEGLSIAALEAQANGVPILASEGVIPQEVKMCDNFTFYSLDHTATEWADKLEEMKKVQRMSYQKTKQTFIQKGYDIDTEVKKLEELFSE